MFSKAKNDTDTGLVEIGDAPDSSQTKKARSDARKSAASGNVRRNAAPKAPSVPSLISSDVVITGSINAEGELHFDGTIDGDIAAKELFIGEGAVVTGKVIAEQVKVAGAVDGTIRANKVELTMTSSVKGDIIHTALSIENGARFDGSCRHSDTPQDDQSVAQRPAATESAPAKPRTVAAASAPEAEEKPVAATSAPEQEQPEEEPAKVMASAETEAAMAEEEAPKPPVLKSLPGSGNTPRSKSAFLNRGGKTDLR